MKIWHDWEFLEAKNSIYPISVGMVTEDGHELYYEFIQAPWVDIYKHEWLKANVIPAMSPGFNTAVVVGQSNKVTRSTLSICSNVYEFLYNTYVRANGKLELWGWYSSYDHVCLSQLFGAMVNLPYFVPMWTNDIKQEVNRLGNPKIPDLRQPDEVKHNALDDARAEMRMHKWLQSSALGVTVKNSSNVQVGNGNTQVNTYRSSISEPAWKTMGFTSKAAMKKFEDRTDFPGWDAL